MITPEFLTACMSCVVLGFIGAMIYHKQTK